MQWMGLFPLMVQLKPAGLGSPFSSLGLVWPCIGLAECTSWEPRGPAKWGRRVYRRARSEGSQWAPDNPPSALHMHTGKAGRGKRDPTLSSTKERNLSKLTQPKTPGERGMKRWMCCYSFTGASHEEPFLLPSWALALALPLSEMPWSSHLGLREWVFALPECQQETLVWDKSFCRAFLAPCMFFVCNLLWQVGSLDY